MLQHEVFDKYLIPISQMEENLSVTALFLRFESNYLSLHILSEGVR